MLRSARDTVVKFGVVGPVALFTGLGPLVGAFVLTATAPLWLDGFLDAGAVRIPTFLLLTAVLAGASLIPTHASSLLGGMAFGVGLGTVLALLGTGLAAPWASSRCGSCCGTGRWKRSPTIHARQPCTGSSTRAMGAMADMGCEPWRCWR